MADFNIDATSVVGDVDVRVQVSNPIQQVNLSIVPNTAPAQIGTRPEDIPGLTAHYDFSNDGSRTEENGIVRRLRDLVSSNRANLFQQTDTRRPTTTTVAGKTAGDFDELQKQHMVVQQPNSKFDPNLAEFLIAAVFRSPAAQAQDGSIFSLGGPLTTSFLTLFTPSGTTEARANIYNGQDLYQVGTSGKNYADGNTHLLLLRRRGLNTVELLDETGVVVASNPSVVGSLDCGGQMALGSTFRFGEANFATFDGQIMQSAFWMGTNVPDADVADLIAHLKDKWQIA